MAKMKGPKPITIPKVGPPLSTTGGPAGTASPSPTFAGASDRDLAYAMMAQANPQPNVTPEPHPPGKFRPAVKHKVSVVPKKATKLKGIRK